ncbi:nuclear transport factor 2 family protein [Coraliomargarita sp. SDUM461004]|uniref:Nuclear transport factor 2 family protein n=1 Tax=Thalassobacterium sedimentorum TaxID=3041258 RepID=A0ABU1AM80_9BACT|nr:hypothetical protein [Coraliomargarita sp. SDUM461004]MDQ8195318.1 nuclear transport factor 2 family protein [Coraliomargarita sp. SDUM461004]
MSSKLKIFTGVAIAALFIAIYFYTQVDWEVRTIRKNFSELVELVEKDGPVSSFEAIARSRQLTAVFTKDARVEYLAGRSLPRGRDEMGRAFLAVWAKVDTVKISVLRHDVELSDSALEASSRVSVNCTVVIEGNDRMRDAVEYRIYWQKVGGDWLIGEIVAVNRM